MGDSLLEKINSPRDLKRLSMKQLAELADEIRQRIILTTSHTGGHLAPNLGAVELTIALHYVLNCPHDKLIWDVGHQSYTHKLLTGRRDRFDTIRQHGGLSGFTTRTESEYDPFGAGHGSTSISAALGFATARDLRGSDEHVVAVIGDGALTGGMALEALNQAGETARDLLVVLNDNEMSINRNVGAMSAYLSKLRANVEPRVQRARRDLARMLSRVPMGDAMLMAMDRLRGAVKELVVPGMLFEQFGFTYLGPIDGHDIPALIDVLQDAIRLKGPVLVHAVTRKGKGYTPAETNPTRYHGTKPFCVENGEPNNVTGRLTYSQVFAQALCRLAENDPRIVAISAAMLEGTGLSEFKKHFPDRCFDVGMAEEHAVTFAAGLAAAGLRPVVAIYSTFLQRAYDQIIHDVALQRLPVVFALDRAGLVGDDGPTHHGVFDLSYLRHIPNLVVMAPADEAELRDMLATAFHVAGPAALRYPRGVGQGVELDRPATVLPVGRAVVVREGKDVLIVAAGSRVKAAVEAAERLAGEGIDCQVINARFVKPLDADLITSAASAVGCVITVEENALAGGLGSAVAELLADAGLTGICLKRLGIPDHFVPHGNRALLEAECGIDCRSIMSAARDSCRGADAAHVKAAGGTAAT